MPQTLRHALSTAQLTMIAIGGAIGTGLFLGSGYAISLAGPGVLLSYAIGSAVALLLMGSLAEMSAANPLAGPASYFAETYVSRLAGYLVRYSYWFGVTLAVGAEISAIAIYMRFWSANVPGWAWIALFATGLILLNTLRVEAFGSVEYVLSGVKVLAIVLFLALGLVLIFRSPNAAFANLTQHGGFLPMGFGGAWQACVVALFSFFSLEMIVVAAAEAVDPKNAVIRAFRGTIARLILFYLGTLAITLAIIPWVRISTLAESPFVRVLRATSIPYAAGILNAVLLVAALSAINSQLYVAARMLFSLSNDRLAPRGLGQLTGNGAPRNAILVSSVGIAVAGLISKFAPAKAFTSLFAIAAFGAMFTWLMVFVTHLYFGRVRAKMTLPFRVMMYPVTPLLGLALMVALLVTTYFVPGFDLTLQCGLPFLALITGAYFLFLRKRA